MPRVPPLIPLLLVLLAFGDLRSELRLLLDHFTWSSLVTAMQQHPLAVAVLVLTPSLIRHYR
ncbi:hypothetical protein [Synechococcus sp. CS-205]|jgi:hypothetical protein|uniref:hypothetical protein n=1 Tax=Synechococcus sp. CS-205 TaxID=2847984 RepID=UPI00223A8FD0|nr:hypothetical protein [Synechococcus sp. CS-205]MCT0248434.1 hypothetical protein [Synechococcus sp. CS-205]